MKWILLYFVIGFIIALMFRVHDVATGGADDFGMDVCVIMFFGWGLIVPLFLICYLLRGVEFLVKHLADFIVRIGKKKE